MRVEPARSEIRDETDVVGDPQAALIVRLTRDTIMASAHAAQSLMNGTKPVVLSLLVFFGGTPLHAEDAIRTVVVTTSMLERATLDLVADISSVRVERLLPPASCPGHFDLSPRVVPTLRTAVLVIRHSYQDALEKKLIVLGASDVSIVTAPTPGSLVIPENYVALAESIEAMLERALPDCASRARSSLEALRRRATNVARKARAKTRSIQGTPVIASAHQAAFCRWLGLDVLADVPRPEDVTPREMARLLATRPRLIVGNLQEGDRTVRALGDRLGVPVAMLSNFPDAAGYGETHAELVDANARRIIEAWRKRSSN
jgi:zinc transport system substrate-binding protein